MEKAVPARPAVGERVWPGGSAGQGRAPPWLTGDRVTAPIFSSESLCEVRCGLPPPNGIIMLIKTLPLQRF